MARAVGGAPVAAGTGIYADPLSLVGGRTLYQKTVQIDETLRKSPRRIEPDREPPFREIDLDDMGALLQATRDLAFLFIEKIMNPAANSRRCRLADTTNSGRKAK
jgi:hypothetical protein